MNFEGLEGGIKYSQIGNFLIIFPIIDALQNNLKWLN